MKREVLYIISKKKKTYPKAGFPFQYDRTIRDLSALIHDFDIRHSNNPNDRRMLITNGPTAYSEAKAAVKALHHSILNSPTSIATAILPKQMADRLELATVVFSLEKFLDARNQESPELAIISAALPAVYMQAEIMANEMELPSASLGEKSRVSMEMGHDSQTACFRSKIDLARGVADLPPRKTDVAQKAADVGAQGIQNELACPEEGLGRTIATKIWTSICTFRGLY